MRRMNSGNVDYFSFFPLCLLFILSASAVQYLHLEMIHRDSIHAPLYPGNLTHKDHLQRLYNYTEARAQFYSAKLAVSGAHQGIAQCQPRRHGWEQIAPLFNPERSKSYSPLPCNHHLCDLDSDGWECIHNQCHYSLVYSQPTLSRGFLGTETFSFASDSLWTRKKYVRGLVFGCGTDNEGFPFHRKIAGILGLNSLKLSLARQLPVATHFSYCLQQYHHTAESPSLLRFGREAILHGADVQTLHFVPVLDSEDYFLDLVDVRVAGRHIRFHHGTFAIHNKGGSHEGGFIIDSGMSMTSFMRDGPYETILHAFNAYLRPRDVRSDPNMPHDRHCYLHPHPTFRAYPSMTLHFNGGVDFVVEGENMVNRYDTGFCLMIAGNDHKSFLGSYQQTNHRISYGLVHRKLSFVPANCLRDH